jgi:hypothetical protein
VGVGDGELTDVMNLKSALISFLAIGSVAVGLCAETIVVPNTSANATGPGVGLSLPFNQAGARWQQIYMSSEFNDVSGDIIEINALAFRIDERNLSSSFSVIVPGINIFMSTTSKTFTDVSNMFANNVGGELLQVMPTTDLPLSGSRTSATSFDVVIPLRNSFKYDRTSGNLLVDIRVRQNSDVPLLDQHGLPNSSFSVFGPSDSPAGTVTSQGLITRFTYAVVPEPSVISLLSIGGLMFVAKRKNAK